jgi:hypothetical protein
VESNEKRSKSGRFTKWDRTQNSKKILQIKKAQPNEEENISSLYSENAKSRSQRRKTAKDDKPHATINGQDVSVLLDSGAVNRNFISTHYIANAKDKISMMKLKYPVKVTSIHGHEIATHCVIAEVDVEAQGETARLGKIEMIVITNAPADIIIGFPTLTDNKVFAKLARHFNTGRSHTDWTREKPCDAQRRTISWKRVNAALSALGVRKADRKAFKKIHVSELLNIEPDDDQTESLLPEDIWSSYLQDPIRAEETEKGEIKFNVYGTENETRALIALLTKYSEVFSNKVGPLPAKLTPMKIDVDEAAWKKRQTVERANKSPDRS